MRHLAFATILLAATMLSPAAAQLTCTTGYGKCVINGGGVPGGQCFCVTPSGPIQGIAQSANGPVAGADSHPHFCCTPAGRLGPFPNNGIGAGQMCKAMTAAGPLTGQACY
jgi:hypothetical protein